MKSKWKLKWERCSISFHLFPDWTFSSSSKSFFFQSLSFLCKNKVYDFHFHVHLVSSFIQFSPFPSYCLFLLKRSLLIVYFFWKEAGIVMKGEEKTRSNPFGFVVALETSHLRNWRKSRWGRRSMSHLSIPFSSFSFPSFSSYSSISQLSTSVSSLPSLPHVTAHLLHHVTAHLLV